MIWLTDKTVVIDDSPILFITPSPKTKSAESRGRAWVGSLLFLFWGAFGKGKHGNIGMSLTFLDEEVRRSIMFI